MNRRIKKKISKRNGYFHYKDYKNSVDMNNDWHWYGEHRYGGFYSQGTFAEDYTMMGLPRRLYPGQPAVWNVGISFSGLAFL